MEDLPLLLIPRFYLISSGDTGNLVMKVSVAMSGCSLLLRLVRGAFAFVWTANEPKLTETVRRARWRTGTLPSLASGSPTRPPRTPSSLQNIGCSTSRVCPLMDHAHERRNSITHHLE